MPEPVSPSAVVRDVLGIACAASVAYGAWIFSPAAGFIVGGIVLYAVVMISAFTATRRPTPAKPEA